MSELLKKARPSPNNSFICHLCHGSDYVPSEIILRANYGSIYDGERMTIKLCGDCFDKIHEAITENRNKGV